MIKQILSMIRDFVNGDEVQVKGSIEFTWWEVGAILVIVGLVVYWICR